MCVLDRQTDNGEVIPMCQPAHEGDSKRLAWHSHVVFMFSDLQMFVKFIYLTRRKRERSRKIHGV